MGRIIEFIRREKIYVFLLIFVLIINLSFSFLNQFLEDSGLDKILEEEALEEELIPDQEIAKALESNPVLYFVFLLLFLAFILFALAGLVLDIIYLYMNRRGKSLIVETQPFESVKWNLWDMCKVIIIFLFIQRVILLADIFFLSTIPVLQDKQNLRLMLDATVVDIIAIAAVLYFVLNEKRNKITSLGLTAKRVTVNIKYGVLAYIGLIPILAFVMYLTTALFNKFNIPIEPQPVLLILRNEKHIPSLIYMGFFTAIFGPFLEEIFFRGFAYNLFKKTIGIFWGVLVSALFFAYIHANLASFFPIFCLGILLAYLYEKTGSLIPSITVHVIHNSLSLIFLLFLKVIIS
jgi:membrane protease YdiL (CAAX protease family)